jgi:hypothetical protein
MVYLRGQRYNLILRIKKGHPGSIKSVRDFFFARTLDEQFSRRRQMKQEQTQLRMTLLLIRDWDGFQAAMREIVMRSDRRSNR